jgi:hypothetical protein
MTRLYRKGKEKMVSMIFLWRCGYLKMNFQVSFGYKVTSLWKKV